MAKGASDMPAVKAPDPIAPVSPTAKGSEEVTMAGKEEKERIRKAFSHQKTVLSRGTNAETTQRTTLG